MNRRLFLLASVATLSDVALPRLAFAEAPRFDPEGFVEKEIAVETSAGTVSVRYRFWQAVVYVANPVDAAYQCLNLSQPVEIDGVAVDATRAPILFANSVGGYMPASVKDAEGVGAGGRGGPPPGAQGLEAPSGSNAMLAAGKQVSNPQLALAAGLTVVEPGCRGRTLQDAAGTWYGVAPAAIVDLKAAVRFLRANAGKIPGDVEKIVSSGTSAGGALSALLGASGDDPAYAALLAEIGAAEASDAIFATGAWCPIADLEHADMAYEWNWAGLPCDKGEVDTAVSAELAAGFPAYQESLALEGRDGFGPLTAANYGDYLVTRFLQPEATRALAALDAAARDDYLAAHPTIIWDGKEARFDWAEFLAHVGSRKKTAPAFDAFDLSTGENNLFGRGAVAARHFTPYGAKGAVEADIPEKLALMNPMVGLASANPGRSRHWWLRVGAKDSDTALTVVGNLDAAARKLGDAVDTRYYWDEGHGANTDAEAFVAWITAL